MSDEKKDPRFEEFKQEEIRKQGVRFGVARILKASPVKIDANFTYEQATDGIVERLKQDYELVPNDNGSWVKGFTRDGKEIDLTRVAQDLFLSSSFVDKASVHEAVESGALAVECRDDLRDVPSKVKFISRFGEDAFAKLPQHRTPKTELDIANLTAKQYRDLHWSQRSKIVAMVGEQGVFEILRRK